MLVRRLRRRGVNTVVEAHGEVLFAPGTDLSRWKNRFSQRILAATIVAAPENKRPRWDHYGKPLKGTFKASTATRITKGGGYFYIAVGSTAPYAAYVDQGTGVFAGGSPYPAKILPPWSRGSASLYENTWRPPGSNKPVRPVMIKGQRGQFFFDAGLKNGFRSMRLRSFQVPGDAAITSALATFPDHLANFGGNTPADTAFRAQLTEWRAWRDKAFDSGRKLGRNAVGYRYTESRYSKAQQAASSRAATSATRKARRAAESALRSKRWREKNKAALTKPTKPETGARRKALQVERARFIAAAIKKYGMSNVDLGSLEYEGGYWYLTVKVFTKRDSDGGIRPEYKEVRGRKVD